MPTKITQTEVREGRVVLGGKAAYFLPTQANPTLDEMHGRVFNVDPADGLAKLCGDGEKGRFVLEDFDSRNKTLTLLPLTPWRQVRVRLTNAAAIAAGVEVGTAADGEIEAGAGFGIVEEAANAGGAPLIRPL